ncbi:NADH-quinone oxidoreductase subunit NuoE [Chloroflexota bacterium]
MSKNQKETPVQVGDRDNLLVLLKETQDKSGYLSQELLAELAQNLGLPRSDVYGVATFYSLLSTRPLGRNVIRVCKSLPCYLKNSEPIIDCIAREIGVEPGETTADGRFSFQLTNCIGACDKAPAMMINHDVYDKIAEVLAGYR